MLEQEKKDLLKSEKKVGLLARGLNSEVRDSIRLRDALRSQDASKMEVSGERMAVPPREISPMRQPLIVQEKKLKSSGCQTEVDSKIFANNIKVNLQP